MKRIYHCTECGGYGSHHPLCPNYVDPPEERNADDMRDEDNDRADQRAREYLKRQMEKHFFGDGADAVQGYVPPPSA